MPAEPSGQEVGVFCQNGNPLTTAHPCFMDWPMDLKAYCLFLYLTKTLVLRSLSLYLFSSSILVIGIGTVPKLEKFLFCPRRLHTSFNLEGFSPPHIVFDKIISRLTSSLINRQPGLCHSLGPSHAARHGICFGPAESGRHTLEPGWNQAWNQAFGIQSVPSLESQAFHSLPLFAFGNLGIFR